MHFWLHIVVNSHILSETHRVPSVMEEQVSRHWRSATDHMHDGSTLQVDMDVYLKTHFFEHLLSAVTRHSSSAAQSERVSLSAQRRLHVDEPAFHSHMDLVAQDSAVPSDSQLDVQALRTGSNAHALFALQAVAEEEYCLTQLWEHVSVDGLYAHRLGSLAQSVEERDAHDFLQVLVEISQMQRPSAVHVSAV